jgi:hypothetical protein
MGMTERPNYRILDILYGRTGNNSHHNNLLFVLPHLSYGPIYCNLPFNRIELRNYPILVSR